MPTVVPSVTERERAGLDAGLLERAEDRLRGRRGRRRLLADDEPAGLVVEHDEVGERAPGVDPGVERHAQPSAARAAVPRQPVLGEEPLAVGIAEVGALALGLRAPGAPEERPAAEPAGDGGVRAAPVDGQRPPLAHGRLLLEDAVAVVELGRGLASRERRPARSARGRASPRRPRARRPRAPAGTTTTPSSSPRTRSPGATATPAQVTGSPQPVTSARPNESRGRDRGRERRHAEAADAGDVADAAVGDDADAAAREHPRRQQLAPDGDVEQAAGGEHDDRAGRRRVDRCELVLVRVLEQLVARGRGDRERAARRRTTGPPCSGRTACSIACDRRPSRSRTSASAETGSAARRGRPRDPLGWAPRGALYAIATRAKEGFDGIAVVQPVDVHRPLRADAQALQARARARASSCSRRATSAPSTSTRS